MMRWCLLYQLRVAAGAPDVSSDRAAKFPRPVRYKRRSSEHGDRGIFRDVQVGVIGYAAPWCGLCPGDGAAVFAACALLSCCPVVVADVSVISCCRVLPVLCGGRTITANKEAGFVEFWRAAGATCPVPLCCSGRYPVALALLRLYRWTYRDRYAAGNRFCSSAGAVSCFFSSVGCHRILRINPVTTPCRKISVTATMARKAVHFCPVCAFFQFVNGGLYRVFLFVVLRIEKLGLPFSAGFPLKRGNIILSVCRECLRFIGTGILFSSFICTFPFIKNIKIFL